MRNTIHDEVAAKAVAAFPNEDWAMPAIFHEFCELWPGHDPFDEVRALIMALPSYKNRRSNR